MKKNLDEDVEVNTRSRWVWQSRDWENQVKNKSVDPGKETKSKKKENLGNFSLDGQTV